MFHKKTFIKIFHKYLSKFYNSFLHTSFPHNFSNQFFHPFSLPFQHFSHHRPLGSFGLVVAMSIYEYICLYPPHAIFFYAFIWPSDHMISSRPLIGHTPPLFFICQTIETHVAGRVFLSHVSFY